jgi:nucleotide-binding universal stress UspA family protein
MSLTVLTVIDDSPIPAQSTRRANRYPPNGGAERYVAEVVQKWQDSAPGIAGVVLKDPIGPASAIRSYLRDQPAGIVAVGTHARSGLQRLRHAATAASIVRASVAPCLIVPS